MLILALTNENDEAKDTTISFDTERTEVLYGIENAMNRLTQVMSKVAELMFVETLCLHRFLWALNP